MVYDQLTWACVGPPGMGHLEDPRLTSDLTMARDFDLSITGPAAVDLDGFHRVGAGGGGRRGWPRRSCWPLTLGGPLCCWAELGSRPIGCCARAGLEATAIRKRFGRRSGTPTTRIAWPSIRRAAKELRLFGLADWIGGAILARAAGVCSICNGTPLGSGSARVLWSILLVVAANIVVFWAMASAAAAGRLHLGRVVTYQRGRRAQA